MKGFDEDYAKLLDLADHTTGELARAILDTEGIPHVTQGPDFDVVELGLAAHTGLRGASLYVPHAAFAKARALLVAAWGEGRPGLAPAPADDAD